MLSIILLYIINRFVKVTRIINLTERGRCAIIGQRHCRLLHAVETMIKSEFSGL